MILNCVRFVDVDINRVRVGDSVESIGNNDRRHAHCRASYV